MSNIFSAIFHRTPKITGHRVAHTKTVRQVLGLAFDYPKSIRRDSAFVKRILKFSVNQDASENIFSSLFTKIQKIRAQNYSIIFTKNL